MTTLNHTHMLRFTFATLAVSLLSLSAAAQGLDIDISSDGISINKEEWYENPLIWIGAVLVLILVVVLSRRTAK